MGDEDSMALSELEKWKAVRQSLSVDSEDIEIKHQYGLWAREIADDGVMEYKRSCKKCGKEEVISSHLPLENIESEIKRQEKAGQLVEMFVKSDDATLTNENILSFLCMTSSFQTAMDTSAIVNKLRSMDKYFEEHHDYEEAFIHNSAVWLERAGYIPDELLEAIAGYLNSQMEQRVSKGKN